VTKHKVGELEGALLDAAVATAMGAPIERLNRAFANVAWQISVTATDHGKEAAKDVVFDTFCPSKDWSVGGPLIERERIILWPDYCHPRGASDQWRAQCCGSWDDTEPQDDVAPLCEGSTPLIAAMRAYVASKFGDEVELPDL
jgi:hypothetical protein